MKILIIGGYGNFGGRLAELLSGHHDLTLIIAGRSRQKAEDYCRTYEGLARTGPLQFQRDDVLHVLKQNSVDLVVDASGPFQDYGEARYAVINACIDTGTNYLDFADGAAFVRGVSAFNRRAQEAGIFVLSGVSSFPVLTAAVVDHLSKDMTITAIEGGIAPSPHARVGLNVMRAVLGYAGASVPLMRNGKVFDASGLAESRRFTVAPPGKLPLHSTHFSLVDVPDLLLLPDQVPSIKDSWLGAGPRPTLLLRVLNGLARLRGTMGLPALTPLAGLCLKVLDQLRFGEHRGGMYIRAKGLIDGKETERSWHLLAEGEDGPYIPAMAIQGIVAKLLRGQSPLPGARPATGELTLRDYDELFRSRDICHGVRRPIPSGTSLFSRILGTAFDALPPEVAAFHEGRGHRTFHGRADIRRGSGFLANMIATLMRFPSAGDGVSVRVSVSPEKDREVWTRDFNGKRFSSRLSPGKGRNEHLLIEQFGPIRVALALVLHKDRLYLIPRRWSLFGVPLPKVLMPGGDSYESAEDGAMSFSVIIRLPLIGEVIRYRGNLRPESGQTSPVMIQQDGQAIRTA